MVPLSGYGGWSRRCFVICCIAGANFLAPALALAENAAPSPGLDTSALVRVTLGLALVLAVIVGLGWAMRRMGAVTGSASGRLRVLGGVSVGNRERVVLLQVGEEQLLIGVAPGRVQTLHVLDKPLDVAGGTPGTGGGGGEQGFSSRLQQLMSQGGRARRDPTS